jgi:hypothetical protein
LKLTSKAEPHVPDSHQGPVNITSACFLSYYFCNTIITGSPKPCNCQLTFGKCKCFTQNLKGKPFPTLSELCGGLCMQHDLAESIFKDEPKKKIIVISGKGSL